MVRIDSISKLSCIGNDSSPLINNILLVHGLKPNLLSISQLCDNDYYMIFNQEVCKAITQQDESTFFIEKRMHNIYKAKLSDLQKQNVKCP